jgi:hypothetical protein
LVGQSQCFEIVYENNTKFEKKIIEKKHVVLLSNQAKEEIFKNWQLCDIINEEKINTKYIESEKCSVVFS